MGTIRAITFDLWDTLVIDDSDEAKRAERGLRSKFDERRHLLWEALNAAEPIDLETVRLAYNVGDAAFNKAWKEHHITWPIDERLRVILSELGRELPEDSFNAVARAHEEMEVEIPPDAMPGAASAKGRRLSSGPRGSWPEVMISTVPSATAAMLASRSASWRKGGDRRAKVRKSVAA